ncbi:TIGR02147 family protein [Bdellovibrio bacteriovorus]|uniref:TIGR02147 family protein n=1 Tax=Bdellovibrio bacteriovorus TaxID=959 RepID=UPI0035A5CE0D
MKTLNKFFHKKFEERRAANPRFSLRALAQRVDISPGHLSEIFNNKRPVSSANFEKLIAGLRLSQEDHDAAIQLFESEKNRKKATYSIERVLTKTEFSEVSGVDFFLVLAAMDLHADLTDIESISNQTGVSPQKTVLVMDKLEQLGLVERQSDESYIKAVRSLSSESDIPNFDVQKFHLEAMQRSSDIFHKVPTEKRDMVYVTMAVNPKNLNQAKKELEKCWKKVYSKLSQGECTEIYTLGMQLLPAAASEEMA